MFVKVIPVRGDLKPISRIYLWKSLREELERKQKRRLDLLCELSANEVEQQRLIDELSSFDV